MTLPPAARQPRTATTVLVTLAAVLVLAGLAGGAWLLLSGNQRDEHAEQACSMMKESDGQNVLDGAITQIKAIGEARKSGDKDLVAAANATSTASQLPFNDPLYKNPGDVQANAVRAWCADN